MNNAKYQTLFELRKGKLHDLINPIPSDETLRAWFDQARIPRFKSNPGAKRGGGTIWYSVAAVEKYFSALIAEA